MLECILGAGKGAEVNSSVPIFIYKTKPSHNGVVPNLWFGVIASLWGGF